MKQIVTFIRRKLSVRISLWVVLFAAIIFNIALGLMFYQARETVRLEAISRATQILENNALRMENILNRVEEASNHAKWLIERHADQPDSIMIYSRSVLQKNPEFYNCSIAFEPYHFKAYGRYFSAYTKHVGDSLRTVHGGSDHYQYFYMDWYLMSKLLGHPCWTEPYIDYDKPTKANEMVSSYCQTLTDKQGHVIGVISISLSLSWLSQTISAMKPYPHSYSIMIGRGGTYFVHPDTTKITRETIFTQTIETPDTAMTSLGNAMKRGEKGMKQMNIDGEECYVFYEPLGNTGCSMAIICPESDIFSGFNRLHNSIMAIVLIGLLLMFGFFIRIITYELKPLRRLAHEAEAIASGQFDVGLTDSRRIDEIGLLSHSFENMQQSLVKYIEELKDTTTQKASIDRDILIASDIQRGMLPKHFPTKTERDDVQLYATLTPAKAVGGDLFDFYFRDEKLFFCIGDVSGKGVPSSLFMALTRSAFRTVSAQETMPDRIVTTMTKTIADMNNTLMFVTLFVGVLDLPTGRLYYCNAGHNPPLLLDSDIHELPCDANLPVGLKFKWEFTRQEIQLATGTTIFLYTDGLAEAMNIDKAQFEMKRINEVAAHALDNRQLEPRQFIGLMTEAVHQFVGDAEQSDDLTMMAVRFIGQQTDLQTQRLVLTNNIKEVPRLNVFIKEVCKVVGFDDMVTMQVKLATEEAVVNAMEYAYPQGKSGNVTIEAAYNNQRLKITIIDSGKPFDPTIQADVDTTLPARKRSIGGLGIHIMRKNMDSINYERIDDLNVLTLRKNIK